MMLSDRFSIDKDTLRKDFYSPENKPQRRWFFQQYKGSSRKQIQDKFYEFVKRVKINVLFFDWFHAYTIRENLDYPWKQDIIDSNDKPVMATSFKTKDVNEEISSKDIKSLMEQANYTNRYLQVLGESIKEKVFPKQRTYEESTSNVQIEKPLFKPFRVSDNNIELLNKIDSLLKVILEIPQPLEESSKMRTRNTSRIIDVINEDSDQNSEQTTETERGESNFKSFSANNIYEWNIDAQTEYNIMNTLQLMTMVATTYQTSHECSEETIMDILVEGFSGQLKGWWDN
ncbi:hypothetical protein JHK84_029867 [Glycine max]|uniref:Uncharacterized protein n=1 Tax=Glycine max TaxID=3847 RepID=A0A0R0HRF9_SOYBN|nr:hypothetical protein JHK84_029867 [Glycine max]